MKRNSVLCLLSLFIVFVFPQNSFAQNTIDKDSDQQLIKEFSYFISSDNIPINEIISHNNWKDNTTNNEESLITKTGYLHIRFILYNNSSKEDFLLTVSKLEDVVYYDLGNISVKKIGQNTLMSQREVKSGYRNYAKIKIKPNAPDTLYASINMNANSINARTFDFEISNEQKFTKSQTVKLIIQGILIGALLIMCFFNLFVFFIVRDKNHLLYVITVFLVACVWVSGTGEGYLFQYLYPETPSLTKFDVILLPPLYAASLIFFIQSYLKTKLYTPKWHYFLWLILVLGSILLVTRLLVDLPFEMEEFISFTFGLVTMTSIFCISLFNLYKKTPQSKYFLYGNLIFYPLALFYILDVLNIIPSSKFSWYAMEVGNVIEMLFFSLALGHKINTLEQKHVSLTENLKLAETNLKSLEKESESIYFSQSAIQVKFEDIILLESSDHYVLIHVKDRQNPLLERIKMTDLVQKFPSTLFTKVHRSYCVNMNHIASRPSKYLLKMSNGAEVTITKTYVNNLGNKFLK
jgi:hypothetical protein